MSKVGGSEVLNASFLLRPVAPGGLICISDRLELQTRFHSFMTSHRDTEAPQESITKKRLSTAGDRGQTRVRLVSQKNRDLIPILNLTEGRTYPFYFNNIGVWLDRNNDFKSELAPYIASAARNRHAGFCNR